MATIADCSPGDYIEIGGVPYRPMIKLRGGWLCRINNDGVHVWMDDHVPVEVVKAAPVRDKKKGSSGTVDPLDRMKAGKWENTELGKDRE